MQTIGLAQWAHDIRNTLGTVVLALELLERSAEPATVRIATCSNASLKKAADLCSGLMNEAASTGARLHRQTFDIMQAIDEVLELIGPVVDKPTTLSVTDHGPVYVTADPQHVFRILFNLVHNAVGIARATGGIRRIELSLQLNGAIVRVRIADDGPGLPDAIRRRPFRHGRSTTGSTGYGLSIARELAERNGGMLELSDTGGGTEFVLELPAAAPVATAPTRVVPEAV